MNQSKKRSLLFITLSGFLSACSSPHEKAEKYYHQEAFKETIDIYSNILERDPKDRKAHWGLKKAQRSWISQNLLLVRRHRLSKNLTEADFLLKRIFKNQKKWQTFPRGAAVFTQKEEVQYAQKRILFNIYNRINEQKPLAAYWLLYDNSFLFESRKLRKSLRTVSSRIQMAGLADCKRRLEKMDSKNFYYGKLLSNYCSMWNFKMGSINKIKNEHYSLSYSDVKIVNEADSIDQVFAIDLRSQALEKLRTTPWYHPLGERTLNLKLVGKYFYNYNTQPTKLTHSYNISVPYEVTRIQKKIENRKDSTSSALRTALVVGEFLAAIGGATASERRYDNGNGTETIIETRYRPEPRTVSYDAISHRERFSAQLALTGILNHTPLEVIHSNQQDYNSVSHATYLSSAGLFPKKADLMGPEIWIQNEKQELAQTLGAKLLSHWKETYCRNPELSNTSTSLSHEWILRCFQGSSHEIPAKYQNWFQGEWGVSFDQAQLLFQSHRPFLSI